MLEIPKSSINLNFWAWGGSRAAEGFPQLGNLFVRGSHCLFSQDISAITVKLKLQCAVEWTVGIRAFPAASGGWSFSRLGAAEMAVWPKYKPQCSGKGNLWQVQTLLFPCLYQQVCSYFTVPFSKFLARGLRLEHSGSLKQFAAGGYGGAISQF